jgi:16S rRNA (uracil1498-N3)-methyltransferase
MRRRFFVDQVRNGRAEISGDDARHLTRVLRVEPGQRYEISDNRNVFLAEIESARKEHVVFRALEKLPTDAESPRITLLVALFKFDRFEWMIEKATELGVSEIVPVESVRSQRGLERAAQKRVERWRKIALEASQQSRRAHLPEIGEPISLTRALDKQATHRFALDEDAGAAPLDAPVLRPSESAAILVGPEGGWTDQERAQIAAANWTRASLGNLILRAETAAIAALAIMGRRR